MEKLAGRNVVDSSLASKERFQPLIEQSRSPTVLKNEVIPPRSQVEGKPKPNPFYLTLIVGDKILHNSMIDSGASTTVMPKEIVEVLNIKYESLNRGVMKLDGNKVQTMGLIKSLPLTLFACPSVTVSQEVVVIDIPPVFGLCLSRDFTAKIGGYLSLDWSHLILRTQHGAKLKIFSEPLHTEHVVDQDMLLTSSLLIPPSLMKREKQ